MSSSPSGADSIGLPAVQENSDAAVKATNQYIHLLSYFCDWQVKFAHSSNCEVSVASIYDRLVQGTPTESVRSTDTDGIVDLTGRHPGQFRGALSATSTSWMSP